MSIITDDMFQKGLHVLFSMYGNNDILFRKSEYYIENPLYRYRSNLEYALEEIKTEEVHLCSPSHFNDPFDSSYEISTSALLNEEFSIDFLLQITSSLFEIRKIDLQKIWSSHSPISIDSQISVHNFMQTIGSDARVPFHVLKARLLPFLASDIPQSSYGYKVACFSEILDSLPMWSYYADEHRGICLKYDIPHLREEVTYEHELRHAFSKVHYSNFRPQNSCGEYSLIVKSSQWSHEYEWRLISMSDKDFISVPCLKAVYLGIRFDRSNIDPIISAIKVNGRNIELYVCEAQQQAYGLRYRKIII